MFQYFDEGMAEHVAQLLEEHELVAGRGLLKTYVIEVDQRLNGSEVAASLPEALNPVLPEGSEAVQLRDGNYVRTLWQPDPNQRAHVFFVDASHPRLWRIYSDATSDIADRFWRTLVRRTPWLDTAWLPKQFFKLLQGRGVGSLTGMTSRFAERLLAPDDPEQKRWLSMKVWGSEAQHALDALESYEPLHESFTLTGVRLRYFGSSDSSAHDEVFYDGKVTSWGRSMEAHRELLTRIFEEEYLRLLTDTIEARFRMRTSPDGVLQGEPASIRLSSELPSASRFVRSLLSGVSALRLTGIEDVMRDDFARILAVDQHVGQSLIIEVLPSTVRVSLSGETCGNSLLRILTVIQQEFDPAAELVDSAGVSVIA
jgi:hypothetical protein